MNLYSIPPLIVSLIILLWGIFVWSKNKNSEVHKSFLFLSISSSWWQFSWFILFNIKDENLGYIISKIGYSGIIFIPITYFHFVTSFLKKKLTTLILTQYIIGFVLVALLWFTPYFVKGCYKYFFGFYPKVGIIHSFHLLQLFLIAAVGYYFLLKSLIEEKKDSVRYHHIKYILLAAIIYILAATDYVVNYGIEFYPLGLLPETITFLLFGYAIIKYHLMDINIVIKKSTLFAWRVLFPVLLFVLFISFGQPVFIKYLPLWLWWLTVAIFGCIMAYYLYNKTIQILKLKDEELEKEKYTYREKLRTYVKDITRAESFEEAATYIVRKVSLIGRIAFCAIARLKQVFEEDKQKNYYEIVKVANRTKRDLRHLKGLKISEEFPLVQYLKQTKKYVEKGYLKFFLETKGYDKWYYLSIIKDMDVLNAEVVFPAFLNQQLYGFLILGNKLDGSPYYKPDLELFEMLTAQAASFIAEVVEREEKIRLFLASWQTSLKALDAKDHYTYGHTQRVKEYCRMLAKHQRVISEVSRMKEGLWGLEVAAELHDIGKLGIPDNILNKPTKLSQEEYEKIKSHPIEGKKILEPLKNWLKENIISGVVQHHENYNGSGYPFGLRGKEIHIYARIIRIVDSVDAMLSKHLYREPLSEKQVVDELLKYKGIYYDPHLVDAFLEVYQQEFSKEYIRENSVIRVNLLQQSISS
jgi:HD-GYP domain-containing protein (c-di-GMP phosphodiesterase class II)